MNILDVIYDVLDFREGLDILASVYRWPKDESGVGLGKAREET